MMRTNILRSITLIGLASTAALPSSATELAPPQPDPTTLRHIQGGEVIGYLSAESNTYEWRGIPYAEPPVGELRWRAPQDSKPWVGTLKALQFASSCSQPVDEELVLAVYGSRRSPLDYVENQKYKGSEDCLYLNIDAPRLSSGEKPADAKGLPVMVYFHGGGNLTGMGFFPGALAAREKVITVAPNYRLGHFGWFSHPALRTDAPSDEDRSGNYGTLDQIRAIRWVRDNIAAFGGDPNNITVFGISAGGRAALALLSSPKANGLFQRAIATSGNTTTRTVAQASDYRDEFDTPIPASSGDLLVQLLITDGRVKNPAQAKALVAKMPSRTIAAYLRGKTYDEFNHADAIIAGEKPTAWPALMIADGAVIPAQGIEASLARSDQHNHVSVIVGGTRDEDAPYVLADGHFADLVIDGPTGPEYRIKNKTAYRLAVEYMSLLRNADGIYEPAANLARFQPPEVFAYLLAWHDVLPWPGPDQEPRGSIHSQDVPLIFGLPPVTELNSYNYRYVPPVTKAGVPGYLKLSDTMMSYWAEFAYTGKPGKGRRGELPEWQPWSTQRNGPKYMVLDSIREGGLRMSKEHATKANVLNKLENDGQLPSAESKCRFLKTLYNLASNNGRITSADIQNFAGGACAPKKTRG
jgi:para-nitrobenzyl esterase